jgi:uncharacterized protein
MRTSVVLDRRGGALKPLLPLFRAGLGGPLGSGRQYFATISLEDWLRAATHLAENAGSRGVYNLTAPVPATNAEFTETLGRLLHRPTKVRAPAWPMRRVLGGLADELLGSVRLEPTRLVAEGFTFKDPTIEEQLASALNR